ncbi:Collagen type IV alpha-3-binding protein [Bienertia sinuspersici]
MKLGTGWLKKAKKELTTAFGNWMIDTNQAFRSIESPYTNPLMETIREYPNVRAPSAYNIAEEFTGGRELARPGITQFATQFVMLESVVRHKTTLQDMFDSTRWISSRYGQMTDPLAVEVRELLSKNPSSSTASFWNKADEILKLQESILKVLKLVDGDHQPTMGFIYEAMERCKLAIKRDYPYYKTYWKMIDKRWNFQLHTDLHAAGCFLNPQYMYGSHDIGNDQELLKGVKNAISRLERDIEREVRALQQIHLYKDKMDSFASASAQKVITLMNPAMWWLTYGESAPELQQIAVKILSQTTSSSHCERN